MTIDSKIDLGAPKEKNSDNKVIRTNPNPSKPAFSTRNILNIFNNNDLIKKIDNLKGRNNKIVINSKTNNIIDLSDSKLKINILGNANKENNESNIKKTSKNNVTKVTNVININNNVTNNINIKEALKNN